MKKSKIYILVSLISVMFIFGSCGVKKTLDNVGDCLTLYSNMIDKSSEFSSNQTTATCEAYKESVEKYIDDCDELTAEERTNLEEDLADMDCSQY